MDGGRALQLKHEINVESTIIERGTAKRDRDQHLVYIGWGKAPCIGFRSKPALLLISQQSRIVPLLPLGRVSLLSELAGRGDRLINMNLESGWLTAAPLSWRLSGRGGACYRNLFSRCRIDGCSPMAKALPASCRLNSLLFRFRVVFGFESCLSHLFVVDFREEKGGIRQRRKAHRAKLFIFRAVKFNCIVLVGLPTRTRPPECLLGSGRSQADTYDRLRKVDQFALKKQHRFESEKGLFFFVISLLVSWILLGLLLLNTQTTRKFKLFHADLLEILISILISLILIWLGIPVIAYCADEQGDEETGSERETDAGRGAQESIGARSPGEGAPNRGDGAWAAQVPQPSTSSSWSGSWIEKWLFPEVSSAAQNEQQQGEGALFQPTHTHEEQPPAPAEPPEDLLKKEIIGIMGGLYPADPWDPENPLIRERLFPGGKGKKNIRPMTIDELMNIRERLSCDGKKGHWAKELHRRIDTWTWQNPRGPS
ncbi:hypothetical protein VNO77_46274 [Canavalia gladiata]|uniref:Uncharacterized protein n=2 Tax=Canavalia gladiata TaxID=3824 RepID=A0AAN9PJ34_CANGL